ncbi:hypothetical protein B0H14DRAFT_1637275 [Mycena olivaceomarginata]|nr:hypothetical protein B0H14DRAFT_1637275 [Mycena olivaceomarginata]
MKSLLCARRSKKLAEERDTLLTYVEAHKALISPLRQLPLDIIEEIFMACLPTHRNCVMSAAEAPVLLGRICSSWRAISLTTPRLWSKLHIVEPTRPYNSPPYNLNPGLYEAKVAQRLDVADAWLRRSGTCPLSISVESNLDHGVTPPLTPSPAPPNTDVFLDMLVPYAYRWKELRLVVPPLALETLSRLTENDVPLLRRLKIVQRPQHTSYASGWSLAQCGVLSGPNLSRFSISGSSIVCSDLPLRWSQLTTLSLMGPAWGTGHVQTTWMVLDILSRCPKLETCKLLVHESPDDSPSVTECPFLHTFDLQAIGAPLSTAGYLLSRLSLPELRDFKLRGQAEPHGSHGAESLISFLAASTHLEAISIDSDSFSKASLMAFIRGLPPTIQSLHITDRFHTWQLSPADGALDDDVLGLLHARHEHASPDPDRPTHCPALKKLVLLHCRKVSDEALRRFVLSRVPTLEVLDVKFDRERQVDILPSLQPYVVKDNSAQLYVVDDSEQPYVVDSDGGLASGRPKPKLQASITYITLLPPQFSPWQGLPDAPPGSWGQGWWATPPA